MRFKGTTIAGLAGATMLAFGAMGGTAEAAVINQWTNITGNGNTDVGSQLAVDVTAVGGTQVNFRFTNNVGIASSITDIYFDDKSSAVLALPIHALAGSAGVSFGIGASPSNLPGGNTVSFEADAGADSNGGPGGVSGNGVNAASEWLDITFNLVGGKSLADVLAEIASGELVIGMHIQSIAPQGGSDSYINDPGTPPPPPPVNVPEPASLALLGMGLLGLGFAARRRG